MNLKKINITDVIGSDFYSLLEPILSDTPSFSQLWLSGGRGSLKSSFASVAVLLRLLYFENTHAVCVRKHDAYLRDSVFNQMLWAIDKLGLSTLFVVRLAPMTLTYKPTGQIIYFKGLDDPLKLKSFRPPFGEVSTVWYEELEQYSGMEELRSVTQSLLRGNSNRAIGIYSYNPPITINSWVNREAMTPNPHRFVHRSTYLNAPANWLGKSFILEAENLKKNNPLAYEHEYLGIATGTGGAVFRNLEERTITEEEIRNCDYIYQGLDWGFSVDPLAFVRVSFDSRKRILYFIDEIYGVEIFNNELAKMIQEKKYDDYDIVADSAEPKSISELWSAGIPCYGVKKKPGSVSTGVKFLQSLNKIVFDKNRTPNAYKEFAGYEYDRTPSGDFKRAYPDRDNHTIDATRYSLNSIMDIN